MQIISYGFIFQINHYQGRELILQFKLLITIATVAEPNNLFSMAHKKMKSIFYCILKLLLINCKMHTAFDGLHKLI